MKHAYSLLACVILALLLGGYRVVYTNKGEVLPVKVTTWDALGYYIYLPEQFIYQDETQLNWFPALDQQYGLSGGNFYQASRQKDGRYVGKYLEGVSILQLPFFLLADGYVTITHHYPRDGFSAPYQYAVAWGCILYVIFALFYLRKLLLVYFSDGVTAAVLLLLIIPTNALQYIAIEGGQSHGYIFPLYVALLCLSEAWYRKPTLVKGFFIGVVIGLGVISRPTEAVMLFIPLFWGVANRADLQQRFRFLKQHPVQLIATLSGIFQGVLPQLLYWKRVTGSYVYDVGSKWDFLSPHFRVLFGWEKGWFIYTPITLLFVIGLLLMKHKTFRYSIGLFCVLNIYIIIAWHIWRYGGSYSCRALVQSYPVFAFPLACLLQQPLRAWLRGALSAACLYWSGVNLFQIWQYNRGILHYDDMNRYYYQGIYLNPHPDVLTMSLLDIPESLPDTSDMQVEVIVQTLPTNTTGSHTVHLWQADSMQLTKIKESKWLSVKLQAATASGLWQSYLYIEGLMGTDTCKLRLFHALAKEGHANQYACLVPVTHPEAIRHLAFTIAGNDAFSAQMLTVEVRGYK